LALANDLKRFGVKVLSAGVFSAWDVQMPALVQSFSQSSGIQIGELLKPVAKVCGAVLTAWLLFATYGLDLSAGFF
jgi:hypothetical protein